MTSPIPAVPCPECARLRDECAEAARYVAQLERDAERYRNGFANLMHALQDAPPLPIEALSAENQAKWTDLLTGLLMALGVLETTGRPQSIWDALTDTSIRAASAAQPPRESR